MVDLVTWYRSLIWVQVDSEAITSFPRVLGYWTWFVIYSIHLFFYYLNPSTFVFSFVSENEVGIEPSQISLILLQPRVRVSLELMNVTTRVLYIELSFLYILCAFYIDQNIYFILSYHYLILFTLQYLIIIGAILFKHCLVSIIRLR